MAKGKSQNNSGYKYKHNHSTVAIVDDSTKIIKIRNPNGSIKSPTNAEDGDKEYILLGANNNVKQIRLFNEISGEKTKDIDLDHDHENLGPIHAHDWINGQRGNERLPTKEEKEIAEKAIAETEKVDKKALHYYDIDEELARRANDAYSFNTYTKNSETTEYRANVDEVFDIADKVKSELTDETTKQKADYLADLYAKKYAKWINDHNKIEASVPSVLITGAGNFPTRKKEKQNERRQKSFEEYDKIQKIKKDIENLKYYTPRKEKQGHADTVHYNFENKHCEVIQNVDENRLQLKFNGKPNDSTRDLLKHNGFKWSPKNGVWQRQLTPNARYTTERMLKELDNLE